MKLTRKIVNLILYAAGVLVLLIALFLIKPSLDDKKTALEATNQKLNEELGQLQELEANLATYQKQTVEFEKQNEEILSQFPAEVRSEDAILYACELSDSSDMKIATVGLTPGSLLYSLNAVATDTATPADTTGDETTEASTEAGTDAAAAAGASIAQELGIISESEVEKPNYSLYDMAVSYDFTVTYDDLKKMVKKIQEDPDKRNISSISLTYDSESGKLSGNMSVNMYFLTGTEKVYETPDPGNIKKGTTNIFGTLKSQTQEEEE